MNTLYRIIIFLLFAGLVACVSTPSNEMVTVNDEDKDIGLGGTGILASTGGSSGLGGTGILGKITGYGSIFVNGIEIEYDNETAFTIDGKTAKPQQLEIGDVVEVLTADDNEHTQAQIINLRHEVIGIVESVEPETFSFTVQGQSVVQAINNVVLPELGTMVAVSGFRIDERTILSSRITSANKNQTLLRTHTELPFKGKAARWLVQTHLQNNKASFSLGGVTHAIELKKKSNKSLNDRLGIKILKLQKPVSGPLALDRVIEPMTLRRGRQTLAPVIQPGTTVMPGAAPGSVPGSTPAAMPGAARGAPGSMRNMKR